MSRIRTILEWTVIIGIFLVAGSLAYWFFSGSPSHQPSGLPDGGGGFYQTPLPAPLQFTRHAGAWTFILTSRYDYTLAGRVVGRHDYPPSLPEGIISLDLAVANGDLLKPGILSFFTFTMGDHTLRYTYDIPRYTALTEEYIDEHISNSHLILPESGLEDLTREARPGSCVIIRGKLADIRGVSPSGSYRADTSTVRNDAYPGGCEIILVESYTPVACGA